MREWLRWMVVFRLMTACVVHAAVADGAARWEDVNDRSPLGINLAGVVDWSPEMVFVDVFKHSRAWISQREGQPWGKGPELELTPEGWVRRLRPGQYATTLMCVAGGHPSGRYVCLYEGKGRLQFQGNARVLKESPGRIELEVSLQETLMLHLRKTDPDDPVRNIRVIMPAFEETYAEQPFYPPFLERWRPFRVVRFMDWMRTNNSEIRWWSERPQPEHASQAIKGVALEHMIELCNELKTDPWFCMPHRADDDYVRRFAEMVRGRLDPGLRVYVEHSNEVWNRQFEQARYAAEQGRKLGLSDNEYQAQLFYHSQRSVEIFRIWEDVFGGSERLVRVLGSHSANPWASEQVVSFEDAYEHADAVGIAPYFGHSLGSPETADRVAGMSLDEVFAACRREIEENHKRIRSLVAYAEPLGLDVIAYEGGQHLVGHGGAENNEALMKLFHAANRDPRMKELYLADLESWKQAGGKLYVLFSSVSRPSKWGSWGLLESENQDPETAPKYQGVLEFLRKHEAWWK